MKTMQEFIDNTLIKVNTSNRPIIFTSDKTEFNVAGLIKAATLENNVVTLYKPNILTGKASAQPINVNLYGCNPAEVADTLESLWYKSIVATINSTIEGYAEVKTEELKPENVTRFEYLFGWDRGDSKYEGRVNEICEACKVHTSKDDSNPIGRAIFHTLVNAKPADYDIDKDAKPIKTAFDVVAGELKALDEKTGKDDCANMTIPVKPLREALTAFGKLVAGDKFRANYNYTRDIYRVNFKGYFFDGKGEVQKGNINPAELIKNMTMVCIDFMRRKAVEVEAIELAEAMKAEAEAK